MDNGKAGNSRYKIDDSTYDTDMIGSHNETNETK